MFYNDGLQMARYLDMRLSARGFDYGGPRHNEDHPGFEAVYGLSAYSNIVRDDLGRYLGTPSIPYCHVTNNLPDGHSAFMTIWEMSSPSKWYTRPATVNSSYKMRSGNTSVVLTSTLAPYLITAGGDDVIDAATLGSQGIGLAYNDGSGLHLMTEAQTSGSS